jgi:siderophore synthetase component
VALAETLRALAQHRPELVQPTQDALPAARASILARLWGALVREHLLDQRPGRVLTGPADAALPYRPVRALTLDLGGEPYTDPARLVEALNLPGASERLAAELDNSVANLALARAAQPAPTGGPPLLRTLAGRADALAILEQCVVDGHPVHPCCRTRTGMQTQDVLRYAPEHRRVVQAITVRIPADRWTGTGRPELVLHPWQHTRLAETYPWLGDGQPFPARPLMSLRTLAPVGGNHHVKTAVDVQMTSAVRTVSAAARHNGPLLSDLIPTLAPELVVMREYEGGAVLLDGEPSASLSYLRRRVPATAPGEVPVPLACLAAPSPASGRPIVTEAVEIGYGGDPLPFFAELVRVFLPPLLVLLYRGVALEAHGQNTIVVLDQGRPVRLAYRDFGGVRVSARRLAAGGAYPPPLRGDLATEDPHVLRTKLFAAAVAGVLSEQVALLHREYGLAETRLWALVASVARGVYAALPAAASGDAEALFGPALPMKATTAMRLAADPLQDLWADIPNPLAELA